MKHGFFNTLGADDPCYITPIDASGNEQHTY